MATLIPARYPEAVMVFRRSGQVPPTMPAIGREVKPADGKEFTLEELQGYVGGNIEISRFPDGRLMVSNEAAKVEHLPVNVEATMIYRHAWTGHSDWAAADTVCGQVLLCNSEEVS